MKVTQDSKYATISLNMSELDLNMPEHVWRFDNKFYGVNSMILSEHWKSQKSHYFEQFEREIGYLLPPGLVLH